jgi:hypothetical protein
LPIAFFAVEDPLDSFLTSRLAAGLTPTPADADEALDTPLESAFEEPAAEEGVDEAERCAALWGPSSATALLDSFGRLSPPPELRELALDLLLDRLRAPLDDLDLLLGFRSTAPDSLLALRSAAPASLS